MDPARLVAFRLSEHGFGTPVQVLSMPVDIVLDALNYSTFKVDYERAYTELNKPSS